MTQADLDLPAAEGLKPKPAGKRPAFPKTLAEQMRAVRTALTTRPTPATASEVAKLFSGARADRVAELLEAMASVGQRRAAEGGRWAA